MKNWLKLDTAIWLSLAFIIVIISLISINMSDAVIDEMEDEYAEYQSVLTESSTKTLQLFIHEVETELRVLSHIREIQNLDIEKSMVAMISAIKAHSKIISTIFLVDYRGEIVAAPQPVLESPEMRAHVKDLFKRALINAAEKRNKGTDFDEMIISDAIGGGFSGFAFGVPVYRTTDRGPKVATGMVVAFIGFDRLGINLLEPIEFRDSSAALIFTHNRGVSLSSPKNRAKVTRLIFNLRSDGEGADLLMKIHSGGKGTVWREIRSSNGGPPQKVLLSYSGISLAGVWWSIGIMTPRYEITKIVQKHGRQSLLFASFVAAAFYIGALVLLSLNRIRVVAQEKARYAGELAEKNKELEKLSNIKDEFVSVVSHDFRSPIGTIIGYAKTMMPEAEKHGMSQKPIGAIIRSSERLLALVDDILDLAKIEAGEMILHHSKIDVDRLVKESLKSLHFSAEQKKVKLVYEPEDEPKTVFADNNKLYQVFNNLIGNAIKFAPLEGKVTVRKSLEGGQLLIAVSDTGPGLNSDHMEVIFEKFKQAGGHHGSGLGLAICKKIVELHNGKIWVESELNKGANFKFTIPIKRD